MFIEKRRFPRTNFICKISTVFAERLLIFNTHTENIGEMGVRVILKDKLRVSTQLDLEIYLPNKEKPIRCKGEIAWAEELKPAEKEPRLFDTGIKFLEISNSDKEDLKKLVDTLISKKES